MRAMVVYDSAFGNTKLTAEAIGEALSGEYEVAVKHVSEARNSALTGLDMLIVGSPTQRFRPTVATMEFINGISDHGLAGIKVGAFDTRLTVEEIEANAVLAFFVRIFGYAAKPISKALVARGGQLAAPPEGFFVQGMEGPMVDGELERAGAWARSLNQAA
jgi:flavodoxin